MKTTIKHFCKALTCGVSTWLVLSGWSTGQANGQMVCRLACESPGAVVARGGNVDPVGELKVRSYRLEESADGRFCLSVTLDRRASLIWVGDDPRMAEQLRMGELTACFTTEWLEEGASVSVSNFSTPYELTTHPERLTLPERLRKRLGSGERMEISSVSRVTREVRGVPRHFVVIVITGPRPFGRQAMNNTWVIQIGRKEFFAWAERDQVRCEITEEQFAALEDGAPVRVNWGFDALPLGTAGKSFARLDKSMVKDW